jgi:hypothetical protein
VIRLRCGAFALAVISAVTLFVAAAQATLPSHLRSATITVQNGSLPPPYGRAHVYRYTTRAAVAKVKRALKANHIAARRPTSSVGCAGGLSVSLKLVGRTTQKLTAYECGGHSYGGIAGNVTGFLSAVGISTP